MDNDMDTPPEYLQGHNELAERVRPALKAALAQHGLNPDLDPDRVYVNGVNTLEERLVIYSQSLTNETVQMLLEQHPPSPWTSDHIGLFFVAYSFEDEHRVPDCTPLQVGEVVARVYQQLI
jgi:hypothetical protein